MKVGNEINTLCIKCRNTCKQAATTRIIICPIFEEKRNEFKHVLKSEAPKGSNNVSATDDNATRLSYGRNSI